jgi:hypothetical protein
MADHDDAAVIRRLRAHLDAVHGLAARWERARGVPEGFRCAWDVAQAAAELRAALARASAAGRRKES